MESMLRLIPAIEIRDTGERIEFDAVEWFEAASDQQIREVRAWGYRIVCCDFIPDEIHCPAGGDVADAIVDAQVSDRPRGEARDRARAVEEGRGQRRDGGSQRRAAFSGWRRSEPGQDDLRATGRDDHFAGLRIRDGAESGAFDPADPGSTR